MYVLFCFLYCAKKVVCREIEFGQQMLFKLNGFNFFFSIFFLNGNGEPILRMKKLIFL